MTVQTTDPRRTQDISPKIKDFFLSIKDSGASAIQAVYDFLHYGNKNGYGLIRTTPTPQCPMGVVSADFLDSYVK